jgi:hypothetical protein
VALDFHAATWQEVVLQTGTLKFIYDPGKRWCKRPWFWHTKHFDLLS